MKTQVTTTNRFQLRNIIILRSVTLFVFLGLALVSCQKNDQSACPVTEPVWIKPPQDSAVSGIPEEGYYYVNQDRSIWASSWWTAQEENLLKAGQEGIKVGWFRPAGIELAITGKRLDTEAMPLEVYIPCCYPTRFQATGLYFPSEGCWEITAQAANSELTFVVRVEP